MAATKTVLETLAFFSAIGRPLTVYEIWRAISPIERPENLEHLFLILIFLEGTGKAKREGEFFTVAGLNNELTEKIGKVRIEQDSFLEEKRENVLTLRFLFDLIPFLDFVCVSGSLALGNVKKDSDFDVVIGCRSGRIFTARFFTMLFFEIIGRRRASADFGPAANNKFCFNHFLTPRGYRLTPPCTLYWRYIYRLMIPIYGKEGAILEFFGKNKWSGRGITVFDARFFPRGFNFWRVILEFVLSSPLGNIFEFIVKKIQMGRILRKNSENKNGGGRIRTDDEELEFHPKEPHFRKIIRRVEKFVSNTGLV